MSWSQRLAVLSAAVLSAALSAAVLPATSAGASRPRSYVLPGHDVFPEGVAVDGSTYYVSSTNGGAVFRGRLGRPRAQVFLPPGADGRTVAVGVKASGGRLFVAGGPTGLFFVYDTATGALVRRFSNGHAGATFLNDEVVAPGGDVYVTDSFRPVLYRIPAALTRTPHNGTTRLPVFVDFTGTPLRYRGGFNANGIVVSPDGSAVVVVQTNTGRLFRIGLNDRKVTRVEGAIVGAGDGMVLDRGGVLYVVHNRPRAIVKLSVDPALRRARFVAAASVPALVDPTTAARTGDRLLVVNSQFSRQGGTPEEPFTVSALELEALFPPGR